MSRAIEMGRKISSWGTAAIIKPDEEVAYAEAHSWQSHRHVVTDACQSSQATRLSAVRKRRPTFSQRIFILRRDT